MNNIIKNYDFVKINIKRWSVYHFRWILKNNWLEVEAYRPNLLLAKRKKFFTNYINL